MRWTWAAAFRRLPKRAPIPAVEHQVKVILEGLTARAVRYHEQNKLGIYKKAKLANVFKWKLTDLGYSSAFVERATKQVVTRLAVKK